MRVRQREQAYSIVQLKEYMPEYDNRHGLHPEPHRNGPAGAASTRSSPRRKDFLYRRDFPIDPGELAQAAAQEGSKATAQARTSCSRSRSGWRH